MRYAISVVVSAYAERYGDTMLCCHHITLPEVNSRLYIVIMHAALFVYHCFVITIHVACRPAPLCHHVIVTWLLRHQSHTAKKE